MARSRARAGAAKIGNAAAASGVYQAPDMSHRLVLASVSSSRGWTPALAALGGLPGFDALRRLHRRR